MELEKAQQVAKRIAAGHAYRKHVLKENEFQDLLTQDRFAEMVLQAILACSEQRDLPSERQAFWHEPSGMIVVYDPNHRDCGTAFIPKRKDNYLATMR